MCALVPDALPFSGPEHADLRARAAEVRRQWQCDEEEWSRAALEHFRHRRTLVDVLRDAMHRGDVVVLGDDPNAPRGVLLHVGDDWCRVDATGGVVELPLHATAPVVRVTERRRRGGRTRDPGVAAHWRARLLELEIAAEVCALEIVRGETLRGRVLVGGDHLVVTGDAGESYVPLAVPIRLRTPASWPVS